MSDPGKPPDFSNLTENLTQQQAKISALKELVRQSESQQGKNTAFAQEKVKNIAQRLSSLKSKTARSKHRSNSDLSEEYGITNIEEEESIPLDTSFNISSQSTSQRARSETPGTEKITLLRKQMELNRVKMAERETKSKEIEEMVIQLKSKFETSQMSLEKSVELGRSMGDLSSMSSAPQHSQSVSDVSHSSRGFNLEKERIKYLERRIRELETAAIENKNLTESERIQKLEGNILDLEENLKEKESIIDARTKAVSLLSENLTKKKKDVVDSLEETKQEMFKMQETFLDTETTYKDEVNRLNRVISEQSDEIQNLTDKCEILEKSRYDLTIENSKWNTKLEDVQDYSTKISELNKLNETLQKQISNLESQRYEFVSEEDIEEDQTTKAITLTDLENKIKSLEKEVESQNSELEQLRENLEEKTTELNVVNANFSVLQDKYNSLGPKSLFPPDVTVDEEAQAEITKLKQQLDDSNKNMIKTKLKVKQLEKQVNSLKKEDSNKEVARLTEVIQTLTQRIADIEEDKSGGQWQEWGADNDSELEKKIKVLETTCRNQTTAIQLLEEQKLDATEDLETAKQQIETTKENSELQLRLKKLEELNEDLQQRIQELSEEKEVVEVKLKRYISENTELTEKLDKLSKGSSAESIEMVTLTEQDNEEYQKALGSHKELGDEAEPEISQELNESLKSLREESSELMSKIELFTIERREVLDKLDALTIENQVLVSSIELLRDEKVALEHENDALQEKVAQAERLISELQTDKEELLKNVSDLNDHRLKLQDEINKLLKGGLDISSEPITSGSETSKDVAPAVDREDCEKLLKQLELEIQNLNKNKDKHQKLKISKKLSENAKSVHTMMTSLLASYFKSFDDCQQLRDDLEKIKLSTSNVATEKDEERLRKIVQQLQETETELNQRNTECKELQSKLNHLEALDQETANEEVSSLKLKLEEMNEASQEKEKLTVKFQEMIDTLTSERDFYETEVQNQRTLVDDLRKEFDQLCVDVKVNNQRLNEKSSELDALQREFDMRLKTSTNEVEVLKTLVSEQKQLLIDSYQEHELDINQKIKEINDYQNQVKKMEGELNSLRALNESNQESYSKDLGAEVAKLKQLLEANNRLLDECKEELLHKQETIDTLNNQIIDLYKTMEENSSKIIEKEDEIQNLQEIGETSREEIRKLDEKLSEENKTVNELKNQLTARAKESELLQLKSTQQVSNEKAEQRVNELESKVRELELKNKEQLDKLKKFAANLKKKQAQCLELEEKLTAGKSVDSMDAMELKAKVIQYEEQLNFIKVENSKLNNSLQRSSANSNDELNELKQKIDKYESLAQQNSQEIFNLQQQLQESLAKCDQMEDALFNNQTHIQKLETEKMKLSESSNALTEVSQQLASLQKERDELNDRIHEHESKDKAEDKKKMDKLKAAVVQLKHKLADKKKEVEDLTEQLANLQSSSAESSSQSTEMLETQMRELQEMSSKILEETKIAYEHDIGLLKQQMADLDANNRLLYEDQHRKVSLEGQLETFEVTNARLSEKVVKLEEYLASLESEKNSLNREKLALAAELEEKVKDFACSEDALTRRVNDLIKQDALIGQKLRETESDNLHLQETIKELTTERNIFLQKSKATEEKLSLSFEQNGQQLANLEGDNNQLRQQIQTLHGDIKKLQATHEQAIAAKHAEIDEMEADLSAQLQRIETDKKTIQEALEKANDQIVDFQDEVVRLKDNTHTLEQARSDLEREISWLRLQSENYTQDQLENEQLRMQLMQSETETENLRSQNDNLLENHSVEVLILKQQISDLEAMRSQVSQNQTDDQVMLQNENVKLKELLAEKENDIQHKTIQLQMVSTFDSPVKAINDPFANLMSQPTQASSTELAVVKEKLQQAEAEIARLSEASVMSNMELDVQANKLQDLLQENRHLRDKAVEMQSTMDNLIRTNVAMEESLERQKHEKSEVVSSSPSAQQKAPSTSLLFSDDSNTTATASLFDDPFALNIPPQEVVEEFIQPKKAYLLYEKSASVETQTNDNWLAGLQEKLTEIHNLQVHIQQMEQRFVDVSAELAIQTQGNQTHVLRIQELEYTLQHQVAQQQALSSQYLDNVTAPQLQQSQSMAALEIEDGWGWCGAENSEMQQQNSQQQASLLSPRTDLEVRLQEQRDIVERLEQEKNAFNEELSNLRDNSKKMMKKLKEYQNKIKDLESRALRKSSSVESNDMDLVIQEELNLQVQKLEGKLKDLNAEREKEQHEKEALTKRVDVLTAANERMVESKERQDSQLELYQLKIRDLNQKLQNLEEWGDDDEKKSQTAQLSPTKENTSELLKKIDDLNTHVKDLQVDYDEVQALLEDEKANSKILEERLLKINAEQQRVLSNDEEIQRLSHLLREKEVQCDELSKQIFTKDREIYDLISKIDHLSNESSNIKTILDDLSTQIQLKTNENQELNQRLQKLANNNDDLSRERQLFNDSMEQNYRQHAIDLEQQLQSLHAELQYKNSQIQELTLKAIESDQVKSIIDSTSSKDQELISLKNQIQELENQLQVVTHSPSTNEDVNKRLQEIEKVNKNLLQEKSQMEHELQVLNDQVLASLEFEDKMKNTVLELDGKNIEIQLLKASLERLQDQHANSKRNQIPDDVLSEVQKLQHEKEELQKSMSSSIDLLNAKWSQAVEQRGNEVAASWKSHLEIREAEFAELEASLRSQLQRGTDEEDDGQRSSSEDTLKMRSIMESQEVEIVSLKEQLAIRSAEYASLSAKVDPYHQLSTSMNVSPIPTHESDRVPRSELDLALYMLHQRDMRLEEMTMELVRLLDERDQLQIRLSNAIRQTEDAKRQFAPNEKEASDISKTTTPEKAPSVKLVFEEDEQLKAKLSELNSVRQNKDKALQDEREQRFMDNMTMLQRDVANIPPEAAARIVGSSGQGQSLLMNWILGKNPDSS